MLLTILQWITTNTEVMRNEKPMVHFCFDQFQRGSDELVTVALYCPRRLAKTISPVYKCCPEGELAVQFPIIAPANRKSFSGFFTTRAAAWSNDAFLISDFWLFLLILAFLLPPP